ncbi:hypothetical protein GCM10007880_60520 [Mesorhizobium amorphae]|nr:hypothetical protein GCM10007880_60520 [Mesorhizobium amorphae]
MRVGMDRQVAAAGLTYATIGEMQEAKDQLHVFTNRVHDLGV